METTIYWSQQLISLQEDFKHKNYDTSLGFAQVCCRAALGAAKGGHESISEEILDLRDLALKEHQVRSI